MKMFMKIDKNGILFKTSQAIMPIIVIIAVFGIAWGLHKMEAAIIKDKQQTEQPCK